MRTIDFPSLKRNSLQTLQVNIGYKCNQACAHCHVNASPRRNEMMSREKIDLIIKVLNKYKIQSLDITGGAPEMHPEFKYLVSEVVSLGIEVIDRCNLTILSEPGYEYLAQFLADNKVKIVASLPCYLEENVNKQRGEGVFEKSIIGLKKLNSYGYANAGGSLILDLVYNPQGSNLPPPQLELESNYRKVLLDKYNIRFSKLLAITNMPINRFATQLKVLNELDYYQRLLIENYNPDNLNLVMCKNTISVDWEGYLFDCDFNQQLGMKRLVEPRNLSELLDKEIDFNGDPIQVGNHCFGCTAGAGSSCGGALKN